MYGWSFSSTPFSRFESRTNPALAVSLAMLQRTIMKQIAWNMLHEIWNICMMQQINIFQGNSAHYETRNICFFKYISWNLLIVFREEMLCNFRHCCHVFRRFKWKDYNKLHEIYFLSAQWAANMLHTIYLWNMFHAICFLGLRCALQYLRYILYTLYLNILAHGPWLGKGGVVV